MNFVTFIQMFGLVLSMSWIAWSSRPCMSDRTDSFTINLTHKQLEKKARALLVVASHQATKSPCRDVFALEPLLDLWGRYVRCQMIDSRITLTSAGPDREFNSQDDVDFQLSSH